MRLIKQPYGWFCAATVINVTWAVLCWLVFFVGISGNIFHVPMGLGGAVYPTFFLLPVFGGSVLYELLVVFFRRDRDLSTRQLLLLSLWIPFALIAVCLVVFCPMDIDQSYLSYLWSQLW